MGRKIANAGERRTQGGGRSGLRNPLTEAVAWAGPRQRFSSSELNLWCNEHAQELREGLDYPFGTPLETIRARLQAGARRRGYSATVWQENANSGSIRFFFRLAKKDDAWQTQMRSLLGGF